MRSTTTAVTFKRPFLLTGMGALGPAGSYAIHTEEEGLAGEAFTAWKSLSTVIDLNGAGGVTNLSVDLAELLGALWRDGAQDDHTHPSSRRGASKRRHMVRRSRASGQRPG